MTLREYLDQLRKSIRWMLLVLGLGMIAFAGFTLADEWRTDWQPADIEILGFVPRDKHGRHIAIIYYPWVQFAFMVEGESIESQIRANGFQIHTRQREVAEERARRRFSDLKTIYYDPAQPTRTRLNPSWILPASLVLILGMIIFAIALRGLTRKTSPGGRHGQDSTLAREKISTN